MNSHDNPATPATVLPPMGVLQDALRKTTETLARELAAPCAHSPRWSELEWQIAEAAAVMQGISGLLANRLRWCGPLRWQEFLEEQRCQTELRQLRIDQRLKRLDEAARAAAVPMVALKGAALYRLGMYPRRDRPMGDIDLLVDARNFAAASALILANGYRASHLSSRHQLFEPLERPSRFRFGEHPEHPIKIDLHTRIAERLPIAEAEITALILPQQAADGINAYPSEPQLMRHLLLHAANNMRARALRFVQLHDIALLARRFSAEHWQVLLQEPCESQSLWWLHAPLALTARYFPTVIPAAVLLRTRAASASLLLRAIERQTLTDVSWSQLHIQAFPGIEWCRSPLQAVRFMKERIFPSRSEIEALHTVTVKRPYGASVPWYGLSHIHRMVRWVVSSPPRVQAIYPIRIALGLQQP